MSKDERLKVVEKRVKNKLIASCQHLWPHQGLASTPLTLREHSTGQLPGDKRNTCYSLLRCGLGEKPLSDYLDTLVLGWTLAIRTTGK